MVGLPREARCPNGHQLGAGQVLVGHQACRLQRRRRGGRRVRGHPRTRLSDRFPLVAGCGHQLSYTTPNILIDNGNLSGLNPFGSVIPPNLFPGVSISADLGNGPGIQEVATFSVDVAGPHGKVAVSNAHGTVTGAAGGVLLRPFARLISKAGDSVTTYGEPWNMN